ncbi:hypothetical protein [Flavobacterium ardleyense]|uniref:hypothetical protein n=1 Tax=Flavobacterium ardleyense TaxID=2038737 RepID=UPI00298C86B5|nr:hypothetical protein [Flavobacterium ardleyense]
MEINKFRENLKLSREQREINHWSEIYDNSINRIETTDEIASEHQFEVTCYIISKFKKKYPFYNFILELISSESNQELLRLKIVEEIISYLETTSQNCQFTIDKSKYQSISKKKYSAEIKSIRKDIDSLLHSAFLKKKYEKSIIPTKTQKIKDDLVPPVKLDNKKPGRKPYSEIAVIALKYHIIAKFNKVEDPHSDTSRFPRLQDFYQFVALKENINPGSFTNTFKEINREKDLVKYCKSKPQVVEALKNLNCFTNNEECLHFISQFDTNTT